MCLEYIVGKIEEKKKQSCLVRSSKIFQYLKMGIDTHREIKHKGQGIF